MSETPDPKETKKQEAPMDDAVDGAGDTETSAPKSSVKASSNNQSEEKMETETSDTDAHLEDIAAASEPDPVEVLETEVAELKDKLLRQAADMENLRRRTEREKQDMAKFAITNFAKDIVTLDDNLTRTLSAVPEGAVDEDPALKALVEGVEMTGRELTNVLERHGIKRIDPKGEIFDPNSHQALFEIPNPEITAGTILEVVAPGFTIDKRVLRPAMVGVAKGGEKPKKASKTEDSAEKTSKSDGDKKASEEKVDKSV
ncbi:MAG: protein GrpE [Methyloligella sp.]|nr:MAG: protein GrpE [Methyloligella sp.]